ncbi:MAG TPA: GIY-YIG nuclease family protein [Polyangiaceae bacterium]|nr:GIY-YIG nuclease family protein [Polyangiaceae bacterium]
MTGAAPLDAARAEPSDTPRAATLADLDVLVVDCQATGASPAFGRVLELGWGVVRGGRAPFTGEAHWIALPDGHVVPSEVRKLTGYEPAFAALAIADRDAWARLRNATAAGRAVPTAIHYARFELAFLREWAARFEPDAPFPFDPVCVHAVARRLYPDLPRQTIRALAGYLGYSLDLTRRALGHVEATAFVWQRLCGELAARGVTTWPELQAFLATRASSPPRSQKPKYPIAPERYRSLPDAPGVYRFLRKNGDVLYVGKAASLKKRTSSHFVGRAQKALAPEMLTQVSEIAVTVVASALEAALLENETIKALAPPYNVQLTASDASVWYAARDFESAAVTPSERHGVGPVPAEYSLRPLAALSALIAGATPTASLRSDAVGVSALFTPDESVFLAGWAELAARHRELGAAGAAHPRKSALALARRLLGATSAKADDEHAGETASTDAADRSWDPARVARHVERAAAQAFRAYRRAHFLRLLHESDVVFREPEAAEARLLRVRSGHVIDARTLTSAHVPAGRVRPRGSLAPPHFDRATYDRLRILTTELKRIVRDGGSVAVHFGPHRRLAERSVAAVLGVV